jgi:hypothetical protein
MYTCLLRATEGSHFWLLVLTSLLAFIRSLAALELGQGLGTVMIMMVMMATSDSLRAVNLAAAPHVTYKVQAYEVHGHETLAHEMHTCEVHTHETHAHKMRTHKAHPREMHAREMHLRKIHEHEMHARKMHAHEMHAREVHAHEMHAHKVHAHGTHVREMQAHEGFCEDLARQNAAAQLSQLQLRFRGRHIWVSATRGVLKTTT